MKDYIRVKINHHPLTYRGIALISAVVWTFGSMFLMGFLETFMGYLPAFCFMIGVPIVTFLAGEFLSAVNGTVTADNEKITLRYMNREKEILIKDISEIRWEIYTEYAGRYSTKRIRIVIIMVDEKSFDPDFDPDEDDPDQFILNDKITLEQLASCQKGRHRDIPLLRIYNFIAGRIPERALGYVENKDGIFG